MNQSLTLQSKPRTGTISMVLAGAIVLYLILQLGLNWLTSQLDQTWSQLLVATTMVLVALLLEQLFWGRSGLAALRMLGFGPAGWRAVLVAVIVSALMLLFFPLFTWLTGTAITLKPNWRWIVIGAVALNGIAEETLFRGFVFGHLRREGQGMSFRRAGWIALVIFAAVHLYLFGQNPFMVGLLGTLVAMAAAFPLAFLFEKAGFSIWPTVILHVATHTIRFVEISEPFYMTAVTAWLALQIGMPFLLFAFWRWLPASE